MKIALFHNLPKGGAKRVFDQQVKFLAKKHEVKVFRQDLNFKGNRLFRDFDNFITLYFKHKKLAKVIDQGGFDVCLVHPDKLTQAPYLLRLLKTPTVYFCEELLRIGYEKELTFNKNVNSFKFGYEKLTRSLRKAIDRTNAQMATRIIVASKYIQVKVKKAYGRNSLVCLLGVDTNIFKIYSSTSDKKINQLLFIGETDEINGIGLARKIADKTNLNLEVISGWKLTDKAIAKKYSQSLATLCLSYNEPFGLVSLEVQACEGIVLAVSQGGYQETIIDQKTGFLLKRNLSAFVKKIQWLEKNKKKVLQIGKTARSHIISKFTWEIHGKCLENLLKLQ